MGNAYWIRNFFHILSNFLTFIERFYFAINSSTKLAQQFWWKSIFVTHILTTLPISAKFWIVLFLGFSEYCVHGGSMSKSPIVIRDGNTSMVALNPFFYFFDFFLWGRTRQHTKVGESESQCLPIGLFMASIRHVYHASFTKSQYCMDK